MENKDKEEQIQFLLDRYWIEEKVGKYTALKRHEKKIDVNV